MKNRYLRRLAIGFAITFAALVVAELAGCDQAPPSEGEEEEERFANGICAINCPDALWFACNEPDCSDVEREGVQASIVECIDLAAAVDNPERNPCTAVTVFFR